jgi:hypothetical protein
MEQQGMPSKAVRTFQQKWRLISLPNKLMVVATIAIAAASVVNLLVAMAMWNEMHITGADTHKSADAAKVAALAAKQSADTQENSFQMERRRAEDQEEAICRLRTDGMAALDHVGHVRVINSGKAKARNVEAHVDTYLADAITLKKLRDLGSVDISTSELSGDQSLDRGINLPLTARDWQNLADTNQVIIDSGHVRYENGFGRVVDEPFCDGWWYFRTPEDKNNPIQGRGTECGQIPQNVAGVRKQKAK